MENVWVRSIPNTCGELEREAKSRKFNAIEPIAVMTFCLVILWALEYPFGVLMKIESANTIGSLLLFFGAMYLLFVSPFIHKDTLSSWGLGNPVALWRNIRQSAGYGGPLLAVIVVAITAALTYEFYIHWIEASRFLFSITRETSVQIKQTVGGRVLIVAGGAVLCFFFATCVIRYDNFLSALFTAVKILAVLGTLLYLTAWVTVGTKAFSDFNGPKFALDVFGYVFWGALQQLLFSSYFGTRLRKGFAPSRNPADRWKKRLAVSVFNGAFFGIIHINSWYLVGVTWILGVVLSWVFMQDKNRNLIALGVIQGFLGSSVGWLFRSEKAGKAAISMGVGPTHMHGFDLPTVLVVVPLVIGFAAFMVYAYRNWQEE